MRFLVLADIDDFHWSQETGQADVLLSCGDVADGFILEAAAAYNCDQIFAVKGNHDISAPFPKPIVDLHLRVEKVGGLTLGGFNGSWKHKPRGHFLYEQDEATALLDGFSAVDLLVAHNSPSGIHECGDDHHAGFVALNAYIARAKPKVLIHGHQHINKESTVGETRVVGVYGHRVFEL